MLSFCLISCQFQRGVAYKSVYLSWNVSYYFPSFEISLLSTNEKRGWVNFFGTLIFFQTQFQSLLHLNLCSRRSLCRRDGQEKQSRPQNSINLLLPLFFFKFNNLQAKRGSSTGSLKIVNSSNRNFQNVKWNVINLSSGKHFSYVEERSWRQEIYVHILKLKKLEEKITELVKATRDAMDVDASVVNPEMESFSQKKGRKSSSYKASIPFRV